MRVAHIINKIALRLRRYGFMRTTIFIIWRATPYRFRRYIDRAIIKALLLLNIEYLKTSVNQTEIFIVPRYPFTIMAYFISGHYDEREISFIRKYISPNYSFIDVGANFGAWTFSLADHFEKVIAFEPDPECFGCLEKTKLHLNRANVSLWNVALAEENKEGVLYPSKSNKGDGRIYDPKDDDRLDGIKIQIRSFDSIVKEKGLNVEYMFLKLDAQGAESWVLKRMQDSLKHAKDVILWTEVQSAVLNSAGENVDSFFSLLKDLGFKPVDLHNNFGEIDWAEGVSDLKNKGDFCFRLGQVVG